MSSERLHPERLLPANDRNRCGDHRQTSGQAPGILLKGQGKTVGARVVKDMTRKLTETTNLGS